MRPLPGCQWANWADAERSAAEPHGRRSRLCKLDGGTELGRHQQTAEYAKKKGKGKTSSEAVWGSRAELIIEHGTNRINSTAKNDMVQ